MVASPTMGTSVHPARLVRMVLVKTTQETVIQDILPGNPCLPLRTIHLPVHQELKTVSTLADVQNTPCVAWATINNMEGGGGSDGGIRSDSDRLGPRNIESGMNSD